MLILLSLLITPDGQLINELCQLINPLITHPERTKRKAYGGCNRAVLLH